MTQLKALAELGFSLAVGLRLGSHAGNPAFDTHVLVSQRPVLFVLQLCVSLLIDIFASAARAQSEPMCRLQLQPVGQFALGSKNLV